MSECEKASVESGIIEQLPQEEVLATSTFVPNTPVPTVIPMFDKKRYRHDAFGKSIFRDNRYTKEIVKWICRGKPELLDDLAVDHIEICPESFLDEELKNYYVDVLYRIPFKNGCSLAMFILIEFKTSNDRFAIFQVVKYMIRIWDSELKALANQIKNRLLTKENKNEKETDSSETNIPETELEWNTFLFPFVLPVIFHQGDSLFTAPTEMANLQHKIHGLEKYTLKQEAFLFDIHQISDSEMPDDLALNLFMRTMRDIGKKDIDVRLLEMYKKIFPFFDKMPELLKVWEQILYYAISSGKHFSKKKFNKTTAIIKEIRGDKMSSIEQPLYLCDVFEAEGFAKGEAKGEAKGKAKGKAEGKAEGILQILKIRFQQPSTEVSTKLSKITNLEQLTVLFERAMYCESLEAFSDSLK